MSTRDSLEKYFHIQKSRSNVNDTYSKKKYPRGFTMEDKRIVNSRYSPNFERLDKKKILIIITIILATLMFSRISNTNKSYSTGVLILIVGFLLIIPLFYMMKVEYYQILIYIIIIVIFGTLGYGWGIVSVIINLNPLKEKNSTGKKISGGNQQV